MLFDSSLFYKKDSENAEERFGDSSKTVKGVTAMTRPTFKQFRSKALKKPGVQKSYEDLEIAYELRKQLITLRQKAGLTQEDVAKKLRTSKSNISRLENVHSTISPKLSTIQAYAEAIGYKLKIDFVRPIKRQRKKPMSSDGQQVSRR